ncbi:hypothetical protein [Phenylobacterium sp.]|uniref:hypothetical protein n=1 Tax=Phenylobacterium sp. TaxID=1871053 RepID=UPI002E371042|nr:hypothetical protein [Phenylobacterium sp.]HEX4709560.1 hypothetical protein [Phenylobacterium sp.]
MASAPSCGRPVSARLGARLGPKISETERAKDLDADARAALLLTAAPTLARLIALFRTPQELYPDEAQYWL